MTAADPGGRWAAAAGGALAVGTGLGPLAVGGVLDAVAAPVLGLILFVSTAVAAALLYTARHVLGTSPTGQRH